MLIIISTDFDLNDLNIVHNKNTANEASIKIKQSGEINITSKTNVNINGVTITPDGDIEIKGIEFVRAYYKTHAYRQ